MSTTFIAGFVSGIAGLIIGSPLDIIKTNDQNSSESSSRISIYSPLTWFAGLLMPTLGLGFLNAILFWSYSLVVDLCADFLSIPRDNLAVPFAAGCFAGVCVCFISVPIELVKVQAQTSEESSLEIFRRIANEQGLLGFCQGGLVTLLRDSIGYGFYFLAYDGLSELLCTSSSGNIWGVLFAGGVAGCISWFVIYPLDLVKTRLQSPKLREHRHLLPYEGHVDPQVQTGSQLTEMIDCFRVLYEEYGIIAFYRGLYIAMVRAFVVNAVIFWVNDWILTITSTA